MPLVSSFWGNLKTNILKNTGHYVITTIIKKFGGTL